MVTGVFLTRKRTRKLSWFVDSYTIICLDKNNTHSFRSHEYPTDMSLFKRLILCSMNVFSCILMSFTTSWRWLVWTGILCLLASFFGCLRCCRIVPDHLIPVRDLVDRKLPVSTKLRPKRKCSISSVGPRFDAMSSSNNLALRSYSTHDHRLSPGNCTACL